MDLSTFIGEIPDFPKPGILFKDITPLLHNPAAFRETLAQLTSAAAGTNATAVAGIEARGFIFGAALALNLGIGFVPIRKPGKLPAATISESYDLEYGSGSIEMHADALGTGDRVILIDDLLATGGTMQASTKLAEKTGADVAKILFVVELAFLNGREKLATYDVTSLITF